MRGSQSMFVGSVYAGCVARPQARKRLFSYDDPVEGCVLDPSAPARRHGRTDPCGRRPCPRRCCPQRRRDHSRRLGNRRSSRDHLTRTQISRRRIRWRECDHEIPWQLQRRPFGYIPDRGSDTTGRRRMSRVEEEAEETGLVLTS